MSPIDEQDVMHGVKQLIFENPEARVRIRVKENEEKVEQLRRESVVYHSESSIEERIESIRRTIVAALEPRV